MKKSITTGLIVYGILSYLILIGVPMRLESVAYRFGLIYRLIVPHLPQETDHQVIASGGGLLSSPAWLQIMADVLGQPILTLAEPEATSRGVALLALESLGIIDDTTALPPAISSRYEPNNVHHQRYQAAIEEQLEAYGLLIERAKWREER